MIQQVHNGKATSVMPRDALTMPVETAPRTITGFGVGQHIIRRFFYWGGYGLILPLVMVFAWQLGANLGVISAHLFPSPVTILRTIIALADDGSLPLHLAATLCRVAAGFGLGVLFGTIIGALSGAFPRVRAMIDPTFQALRAIPSIAWVPLFILWLGIFEASKIALIAVGVFFPIYLTLMSAINQVDRRLIEVGLVYRLGPWARLFRILLPAALPAYMTGLRSGLGLGWMFVVAAELMGASEGIGYLLIDGQQTGKPALILAAILLFALCGKATDYLLYQTMARFVTWQDTQEHHHAANSASGATQ